MKELREYIFLGYSGSCVVAVQSAEFERDCYALASVLNFVDEYDFVDIDYVIVWDVDCCSAVCKVVL